MSSASFASKGTTAGANDLSGLTNVETTLRIDGFPLAYNSVNYPFFGVNSSVSGVGYNVAKALRALGDTPYLLSLVASDLPGRQVRDALSRDGLAGFWRRMQSLHDSVNSLSRFHVQPT